MQIFKIWKFKPKKYTVKSPIPTDGSNVTVSTGYDKHNGYIWMVCNNEVMGLFMWPFNGNLRKLKKLFTGLYIKHPNMDKYFKVNMTLLRTLIWFSFLDFKLVNSDTGEFIGRQKNEPFGKYNNDCNIQDYL